MIEEGRARAGGGHSLLDHAAASDATPTADKHAVGGSPHAEDGAVSLQAHRDRAQKRPSNAQAERVIPMSDTPSRIEIAAQLQAAEARTETRITQLGAAMEARASASAHQIDLITSKIDTLFAVVSDMKEINKETKRAIWHVGIGSVLAIAAIVVALWVAAINVQGNMLAVFQTGLGARAVASEAEATKGPPIPSPLNQATPVTPAKK